MEAEVKAIGTCRIRLNTYFDLDLVNTLFVPSIRRNLISVSKLNRSGYTFNFDNGCFTFIIILLLVAWVLLLMVFTN